MSIKVTVAERMLTVSLEQQLNLRVQIVGYRVLRLTQMDGESWMGWVDSLGGIHSLIINRC